MPNLNNPEVQAQRKEQLAAILQNYDAKALTDEGGIYGITGRKRQGKSLFAAGICLDFWLNGWKVYHNGSLRFGEELNVIKLAQLEYRDCVVFLDEAHAWLDSRRGQTLASVMTTSFLTQIGKLNIMLLWATHNEKFVDLRLRFATDLFFEIEKKRPRKSITGKNGKQIEVEDTSSSWPDGTKLFLKVIDKNGVFGQPYRVVIGWLDNMQDYFPLNDTTSLFAHEGAGKMNARQMDNDKKWDEAEKVLQAVLGFKEAGFETITPMQVSKLIERDFGIQIAPTNVGRYLGTIGVPRARSHGVNTYKLLEFEPL